MTCMRALLFTVLPAMGLTPPTDLILGHHEIHVDYSPVPGNPDAGWRFSVSYDEDDDFSSSDGVVRMDPGSTIMIASPASRTAVPSPAGVYSRFGSPGTPLWVLPQSQSTGALFLGVRTTMAAGLFQARVGNNYTPSTQGSISLRVVSVEGSGPAAGGKFATWKVESFGSAVFSFDTTDGIGSGDEIPTVPVSSHTHYNWAFTKPGSYRVTFEAKGKLMPGQGNVLTSARKTFTFMVPFSSRVSAGGELRAALSPDGLPVMITADRSSGVAYATDRAMLEATQPATAASSALPGARWELPLDLTTLAAVLPNGVGVDPSAAGAGLPGGEWTELEWIIAERRGPGSLALIDGGTVAGDTIPLPQGASRPLLAAFDTTGLYRVTGRLRGKRAGETVTGPPFTLVFGAGVTAEHGYPAWRESFEKSAALPAGTLADPEADHDGDGLANGVEFAFFWQGLDPARADAERMPRPFPTPEGHAVIGFLRDTFKDPLDESGWEIVPGTSADLKTWTTVRPRNPGFPFKIYETSAEEGNARGRILQRRLRVMAPDPSRAFFRFHVQAP